MNIREAKEEIKAALQAYHTKDETGMYVYPLQRQRPVLLMGPPGIGKTAIMEQIAAECGVGLVAYTMTHHTRQSAIGLPRIVTETFEGEAYPVTEYTLSEIIASVYACMKRTGNREGILFIDEINCVSETLAPVMLQFLQNKTFGSHKVPEGWMIVAAGNPAAYNRSVREFDIVTLDRVRRIDVEPEAACWMEYASGAGIHGAILAYLTLKPERFYRVRQEQGEKSFVTARGWEDLSHLLHSYENMGRAVTPQVVQEFLQDKGEAAYFCTYYQIYRKYGKDYAVRRILEGQAKPEQVEETTSLLAGAALEERLTAVMQMQEVLCEAARKQAEQEEVAGKVAALADKLIRERERKKASADREKGEETGSVLEIFLQGQEQTLDTARRHGLVSLREERVTRLALGILLREDENSRLSHIRDWETQKEKVRNCADLAMQAAAGQADALQAMLERAFAFGGRAFSEQEIFLLVTCLARNRHAAAFLTKYPNQTFIACSRRVL